MRKQMTSSSTILHMMLRSFYAALFLVGSYQQGKNAILVEEHKEDIVEGGEPMDLMDLPVRPVLLAKMEP